MTNVKNNNEHKDNPINVNKKKKKVTFHDIYGEVINILYIIKDDDIKNYINYIHVILDTLYKNIHKHIHHYNYTYSIKLLRYINTILSFYINHSYISNEQKIQKKEKNVSKYFSSLIDNNFFYIQKENFSFNYVHKNYNILYNWDMYNTTNINNNINHDKNIQQYTNDDNTTIYIEDLNNLQNYNLNKKLLYKTNEDIYDISFMPKHIEHNNNILNDNDVTWNNNSSSNYHHPNVYKEQYDKMGTLPIIKNSPNEYNLISKDIESYKYIIKFSIELLYIIVKKIKYVHHTNTFADEEIILEIINTLIHIHHTYHTDINNMINEKSLFLKNNIINSEYNNNYSIYFFLFLDFIFNTLKKKYIYISHNDNHMNEIITQYYYKNENFFKILSLLSNIRYLLTCNKRQPKNMEPSTHNNTLCENHKIHISHQKIIEGTTNEKKKMFISKINEHIYQLTNDIILFYTEYSNKMNNNNHRNYHYFQKDGSSYNNTINIQFYIFYLFNDVYLQNNYAMRKIIFSYFSNSYKYIYSYPLLNYNITYLQYITIYNFLKLFKNEINEPSEEYDNVVKIFIRLFDNNTYQQIGVQQNIINTTNIYIQHDIKYYIHNLYKICYFFILSKKLITNVEFINQINSIFYLNFYMINQWVQTERGKNKLNDSGHFTQLINKCMNKIIIIFVIHKYWQILKTEDTIKYLSTFIYATHDLISNENKRKLLLYIFPFMKEKKHEKVLIRLTYLLRNGELAKNNEINLEKYYQSEKKKNQSKNIPYENDISLTYEKYNEQTVEDYKNDTVLCPSNLHVQTNINNKNKEQKQIYVNYNNYFKNYDIKNTSKINHNPIHINVKEIINHLEENENIKLSNDELHKILKEHINQMDIIKQENMLLKNKLNYIVLNFENFISSYIHNIISNKNAHVLYTKTNISVNNDSINEETNKQIIKETFKEKHKEEQQEYIHVYNKTYHEEKKQETKVSIKFNYQQMDVKNEYFHTLKKYQTNHSFKINNILINMYMYNPYICAKKNKNFFLSKNKKHKKIIILPYDTYKNIKKILTYDDHNEKTKIFKSLQNVIYLFYDRFKALFEKIN